MTIWVDADACPVPVKEILFKAAERTKTPLILVANQYIATPPSLVIKSMQVSSGFDVADNYIVEQAQEGDLVITADIPLASEVIDKKAIALNPRGELYTTENIKQRLNIRDFMDTMRASGVQSGGQAKYGDKDKQQFANQLDKYLAKHR
ncbi:YaiI/YqxD family protein [Psychrosphaera aestuarii]|uniref:YaiI/YqxD family protein n=1 Tax=Psychrosphaera aestuarii TaxID=1266052 RepID=UPI001B3310BC|nr:YaiI/YqxD family protein [Psychrosphaera aestuarii]